MAFIKGFKFNHISLAVRAQRICRMNKGFPKQGGNTLQAVDVKEANLNLPPFWYIVFCEESEILGMPETFEVVEPEFNIHPN